MTFRSAPVPRLAQAPHVVKKGESGSMTAETVMLAPLFLLFLLFLVAAGRIVEAQGEVNGAARDAARAASVQRTQSEAESAAREAAEAALSGECSPQVDMSGTEWKMSTDEHLAVVRATVTCELDLAILGFGAGKQMSGTSVVPLEQFRRVQ
ncbi:pilus assembly protein [Microbispora cellulosiformans]|uniref:Pilus assembly protein n=2 Tax=Microbispora cellulosiformans TaxID=2614688 RepID=A0A5J5KCY0_9ACTN|nr:pilus assembly protein [Microbispora cellulosiformans]